MSSTDRNVVTRDDFKPTLDAVVDDEDDAVDDYDVERSDFAPGLDLPDDDSLREHGTAVDALDFEGLTPTEAKAKLRDLDLAQRIEVLFGVELFDYQLGLTDAVDGSKVSKVAIQPGRQVGKTLWGACIAADDAITEHAEDTLITAPYQETADEMMSGAVDLIETAQERISAIDGLSLGIETKNKREIEFSHGGRLLSRTLGSDGVGQRGKNPKTVLVDEAAFVPDSIYTEVLEAFFATHDDYTFILLSTVSADYGYFYRKIKNAGDWFSPYWPTAICPLVEPEWIAGRKHNVDSQTFKKEYLGEFVAGGDRFFDPELIDDLMRRNAAADRRTLALGADIARAGDDQTAILGIGPHGTAEVLVADREMSLTDATGRLVELYQQYDVPVIALDATGLGAGVVEMLTDEIGSHAVDPVKFSLERKQSLYNELKNDLENETLEFAYHAGLLRELQELEYSLTGRGKTRIEHPTGGSDDLTDALALAAHVHRGGAVDDGYAHDPDNVVVL